MPAPSAVLPDPPKLTEEALAATDALVSAARDAVAARVAPGGKVDPERLEREQHAAHGFAWLATCGEALRQLDHWARALEGEGRFGETEALLLQGGFAEYLAQMANGLPMNQSEFVRPAQMGVRPEQVETFWTPAVQTLVTEGGGAPVRAEIARRLREAGAATGFGDAGLDDTHAMIADQFRRFVADRVSPHAHDWHLRDALIPDEIIAEMSALGVFGLTIPEEYGGAGLGKTAMCVVSEELSRGYIGVGSLGTRTEIAAELILLGGTEEQKKRFLPGLASGDILPTAVFTEPNTGSDLGALRTRAVREGDVYKITGNKTWITHGARTDLMTLMARTDPSEPGYRGLSMFLAEKPRGTDENPFPADGMSGGEIEVLGYRGMKEYEIAFDEFEVPAQSLLGEKEGQGFKQLMATFESARIQTAARSVGVAQNALDLALQYAEERRQFGKPIVEFPRVADKLVHMAVETQIARQLTYFAAREKDGGHRCDLEAGMAKLLAARTAWAAADNAVQIHGGNGFALEYPVSRVLCDARILNIFEGAAEIQAQVIARRLLE
ncbi:MAG: acyl-CoA dehydrogenase family protein [Alphaproteobacteria bacterium]